MSDDEPIDLAELSRQWKEIDMTTLKMTAETGRMQARAEGSVWLMYGLLALLAGVSGSLLLLGLQGDRSSLALGAAYAVGTAAFGGFSWRQRRKIADAEALLAEGTPAEVLRARITLLDTKLYAWRSRGARLAKWGVAPVLLLACGLASVFGSMPWAVPAVLGLFFASMHALEVRRVPVLEQQRQQATDMLQQL